MKQRKRKHLIQQRWHGVPTKRLPVFLRVRLSQFANMTEREPLSDVDIGKFLLERLATNPTTTEAYLAEQIGRSVPYVRKVLSKARAAV